MKRLLLGVIVFSMLALQLGCGGGGVGGSGGRVYSLVRVELPGKDPLNIVVGENATFVIAGYEVGTGIRYVLSATSWTVVPDPDSPGTINSGGTFTATSAGSAQIVGTWEGLPLANSLRITVRPAGLARLSGSVRNQATNAPAPGVIVTFYNAANAEVGRATVMTNGSFLAHVPTNTVRMNFDPDSLGGWLRQWLYRTLVYQAGPAIPNCHATFVATPANLTGGVTSNIPDVLNLYDSNSPPPFPSGCTP